MIADDLSVFFTGGEFAELFVRRRPPAPDVEFGGILGVNDRDALQGYAITAEYRLRYPVSAVELVEGDEVAGAAGTFRVRRVDRVVDGLEAEALLSRSAP